MPSDFFVEINAEFEIPDFMDAGVPLEQIAKKVLADAQKNIRQQTNIDGSRYEPLSKRTIQDKIQGKFPYPRRALYRKGIMFRALHIYKRGRNWIEVGIIPRGKPPRDMVAEIHHSLAPVIRTFLGFSAQTYEWAQERMKRWIAERYQKAAKKFINIKY